MEIGDLVAREDVPEDVRQAVVARLTDHEEELAFLRSAMDVCLEVLHSFPNPVWRAGADGRRDYVNRAWSEFTGRSVAEGLGDGWLRGVHPSDRERCLLVYDDAVTHQRDFSMEYQLLHRDGTHHWVHDSGRPVWGPDGTFSGFVGSFSDITERRKAEESLRQAKLIVESSPTIVLRRSTEPEWPVDFVSENIRRLGYSPAEFLSGQRGLRSIVHPDDVDNVAAAVARYLSEGRAAYSHEYRVMTAAGDERWVDDHTSVTRSPGDGPVSLESILRDITERKAAELALRHRMDELTALYDASQALLAEAGSGGLELRCCDLAKEMLGAHAAWIGRLTPGAFDIHVAACSGADQREFERIHASWDDSPQGRGPVAAAIRQADLARGRNARAVASNDIASDSSLVAWRGELNRLGFSSMAAAPLCREGQVAAVLCVYSREARFFSDEHLLLLQSFANLAGLALGGASADAADGARRGAGSGA